MCWLREGRPPLRVAHRGGAGLAPENTCLAFARALGRHRAEVLETDVRATRDGVLVLAHDPTVDRCTDGSGRLADLDWERVRGLDAGHRFSPDGRRTPFRGRGLGVPRLEVALAAFPTALWSLDLKDGDPALAERLADRVRTAGAAGRVVVGSEDPGAARRLAQALPEAPRFFPADEAEAFVRSVWAGRSPRPDPRWTVLALPWIHEGRRVVEPALVRAAHRARCPVWVWTVDDPGDLRVLLALGVDGIVSDRPDRLWRLAGRAS